MPASNKRRADHTKRNTAIVGRIAVVIILWLLWRKRPAQAGGFAINLSVDKNTVRQGLITTDGTVAFTFNVSNPPGFPLDVKMFFRSPNPGSVVDFPNVNTTQITGFTLQDWTILGTFVLYATATYGNTTVTSPDVVITVIP